MASNSDIYTALVAALSAIPALQHGADARVYPTAAPEAAGLPHVVWQQTRREPIQAVTGPTGLDEVSFRLDLAAKTYGEIVSLRSAVASAVAGMEQLAPVLSADVSEPQGEGYAQGWDVIVRPLQADFIISEF